MLSNHPKVSPTFSLQQESLPFICLSLVSNGVKTHSISTNRKSEFDAYVQQHVLSSAVRIVLHPPAGGELAASYEENFICLVNQPSKEAKKLGCLLFAYSLHREQLSRLIFSTRKWSRGPKKCYYLSI